MSDQKHKKITLDARGVVSEGYEKNSAISCACKKLAKTKSFTRDNLIDLLSEIALYVKEIFHASVIELRLDIAELRWISDAKKSVRKHLGVTFEIVA